MEKIENSEEKKEFLNKCKAILFFKKSENEEGKVMVNKSDFELFFSIFPLLFSLFLL